MGGFVSTPVHYGDIESREEQDLVLLNHGLWAAIRKSYSSSI